MDSSSFDDSSSMDDENTDKLKVAVAMPSVFRINDGAAAVKTVVTKSAEICSIFMSPPGVFERNPNGRHAHVPHAMHAARAKRQDFVELPRVRAQSHFTPHNVTWLWRGHRQRVERMGLVPPFFFCCDALRCCSQFKHRQQSGRTVNKSRRSL